MSNRHTSRLPKELALRGITSGDFSFLLELFSNPVAMEYFPGLRDETKTRSWIEFNLDHYSKHGFGKWIIERPNDRSPLGHTGLVVTNIDGVDEIELGYFLHPNYWSQGFATEAAKLAMKLAFEKYKCLRIVSAINPANLPSIQVAKRLGMAREKNGIASAAGYSWNSDVYSAHLGAVD